MKLFAAFAGIALLTLSEVSIAGDKTEAVIGGAAGGAIGAAIGSELGGRDGAIVGSAVGAAVGTAVATIDDKDSNYREDGYRRADNGVDVHVGTSHPGSFCPPGQAKKGRCH